MKISFFAVLQTQATEAAKRKHSLPEIFSFTLKFTHI